MIRMLDNKIAVEIATKLRKRQQGGLLEMPDSSDCTGVVRYLGEGVTSIKTGQTVCYGTTRQRVKIDGQDFEIMEIGNIFAIIDEEPAGAETNSQS